MEGASSGIKKLGSDFDFDAVFGPDELESESPLGPATSKRQLGPRGTAFRFSGEWSVSSNDFHSGACRVQAFQEHVERRLVGSNPFSSVTYNSLTSPFHFEEEIILRAIPH